MDGGCGRVHLLLEPPRRVRLGVLPQVVLPVEALAALPADLHSARD